MKREIYLKTVAFTALALAVLCAGLSLFAENFGERRWTLWLVMIGSLCAALGSYLNLRELKRSPQK